MRVRAVPAIFTAGYLVWAANALADSNREPRDWLERMSTAMSQMDYQGTFVYVQGDDVVTMRITHVADDEGVRERLVSMSGAAREVTVITAVSLSPAPAPGGIATLSSTSTSSFGSSVTSDKEATAGQLLFTTTS